MVFRIAWTRMRAHPRWRSIGDFSFYMFTFATWVPVVVTFNEFVAEVTNVTGPSMYPFLNAEKDQTLRRDLVLNWKFNAQNNLSRGMIVTFWYTQDRLPV